VYGGGSVQLENVDKYVGGLNSVSSFITSALFIFLVSNLLENLCCTGMTVAHMLEG
jgi:hypothetical protein